MKAKYFKLLFIFLFVSGILLRFWAIDSFPPLNRDEAAIGYNAYSILKTGKDEWGEHLPFSFKSFGDYKMPGYIYLSTLAVGTFGLNEFAVRFWSAISGIAAIILLYFLSVWVYQKLKLGKKIYRLSLVVSLFLLFNPWHFFFSRIGFEANLALTLFLGGLTAFLYGLKKRWLLPISSLCFVLNLYTYSSGFIFLPFFLFLLFILFFKDLLCKKDLYLLLWLGILLIGGLHATWSVWLVSLAKVDITIFNNPGMIDNFNNLRTAVFQESPLWARLWLNKPFYYLRIFMNNYLLSFSPRFLIISAGVHPWHQVPNMGNFYWLDLPLIILGLLKLFKKINKISLFLLFWLVLAPLPSAITIDAPHATRMLQIVPLLVILMGLGIVQIESWLGNKKKVGINKIWLISLLVYVFLVTRFIYMYFISYPKQLPEGFMAGIKQAVEYLETQDKNRLVIFQNPLNAPYIYLAFYSRYNPTNFQKEAVWKPPDLIGLTAVEKLGRYNFWVGMPEVEDKAYYVLQEEIEGPAGFRLKKEIKSKSDEILWRIFEN